MKTVFLKSLLLSCLAFATAAPDAIQRPTTEELALSPPMTVAPGPAKYQFEFELGARIKRYEELHTVNFTINVLPAKFLCQTNYREFLAWKVEEVKSLAEEELTEPEKRTVVSQLRNSETELQAACLLVKSWSPMRRKREDSSRPIAMYKESVELQAYEGYNVQSLTRGALDTNKDLRRLSDSVEPEEIADLAIGIMHSTYGLHKAAMGLRDAVKGANFGIPLPRLLFTGHAVPQAMHLALSDVAKRKNLTLPYEHKNGLLAMPWKMQWGKKGFEFSVTIPLVSETFVVYRHNKIPLVLNGNKASAEPALVQLVLANDRLAVSEENEFPVTVSLLEKCTLYKNIYLCPDITGVVPASSTCLGAIIREKEEQARKSCHFELLNSLCALSPGLRPNTFHVTTAEKYFLKRECPNGSKTVSHNPEHLKSNVPPGCRVTVECPASGTVLEATGNFNSDMGPNINSELHWDIRADMLGGSTVGNLRKGQKLIATTLGYAPKAVQEILTMQKLLLQQTGDTTVAKGFIGALVVLAVAVCLAAFYFMHCYRRTRKRDCEVEEDREEVEEGKVKTNPSTTVIPSGDVKQDILDMFTLLD